MCIRDRDELYYLGTVTLGRTDDAFWHLTLAQLLTLADQHRHAAGTAGTQHPTDTGPGLLSLAAM